MVIIYSLVDEEIIAWSSSWPSVFFTILLIVGATGKSKDY
jgi:hypothetical protein